MQIKKRIPNSWFVNILVALVVSLMTNFSYLVFRILVYSSTAPKPPRMHVMDNTLFITLDFIFYFLLALILILIFTYKVRGHGFARYDMGKRLLLATGVTVVCYFLSPHISHFQGIHILAMAYRKLEPMAMLKCSFTLVVVALYGKIYELLLQKQSITIENERLKNENLQSQYNVLVNQINPHFFFNSLNSLAMLVRENQKQDAIMYIDRLSDTFRYVIQSGKNAMASLREELDFLDNYKFLFEIRYKDKLFFEINIPKDMLNCRLPSLSLQPVIENAVKHNTITLSKPLIISITVEGGYLVVTNAIAPKLDESVNGTGTGLTNLSNRYMLLMGKDIVVSSAEGVFSVKLPLSR